MEYTLKEFTLTPEDTGLELLSPSEIEGLFTNGCGTIHPLFRRCALAVLNSGSETDDVKTMLERHRDFDVEVRRGAAGIELILKNAPAYAFVSYEQDEKGKSVLKHKIIEGVRQNVFAVLRDLVFIQSEMERTAKFDLESSAGITDAVFQILRNAGIFEKLGRHKALVCWGGHAITSEEYDYSKEVGYQCGLRLMDVITGCGMGAMKGPMKGAAVAHHKQRISNGRYIGITEPGIIASEAPNPVVDPLVIMPDIEKRLEAFVRLGHGIVIFPGGAGTAEEFMYILALLLHPDNQNEPLPLILTGPASAAEYFERIDAFAKGALGPRAADLYRIIIDDPVEVAHQVNQGLLQVRDHRDRHGDSTYFNRRLHIPLLLQEPFEPSHQALENFEVRRDQEPWLFAANLRRVFSAVVWGNVKPDGVQEIEKHGPLVIHGDREVLAEVDRLLAYFADQGRMRLSGEYKPCYRIIT